MRWWIVSVVFFPFLSWGSGPEIQVQLQTKATLQPLYLGKLETYHTKADSTYLTAVDAILRYDLHYNGSTAILAQIASCEEQLQNDESERALDPTFWRKQAAYVIKWRLEGKTLNLTLCHTTTGKVQHFRDVALSLHLAQDRRTLHQLADSIHAALFGTPGIAHSRILFSYQVKPQKTDGSDWQAEIWECDWDGANLRQVTHEGSYSVTPILIPPHPQHASDRFLYVSYKLGQPKIYISSLKEGIGRRLIDLPGNQLLPTISPQRDQIAFICDAGGRTDLFIQDIDPQTGHVGKPIQLYSYPRSTQASPTFSPDGSKIAFVSDKDGGMRIYVIPTAVHGKRAQATLITKQNRENSCPVWSPDGTKLAYSAKTNHIRQIWIYDFTTQEEWQLTAGPTNKENPCWGPDSHHLLFNSTDGSTSELYVLNLNQTEAVKITKGPGKKHYPSWGMR